MVDLRKVLAIVLAGGRGSRLKNLTARQAKPAVPFGGKFRIIDFQLSNLENSGIRKIMVLLQYGSFILMLHLQRVWNSDPNHGFFVYPVFPQHIEHTEYQATADAVMQNMEIIDEIGNFQTLLILAGDHVCKKDYRPMLEEHYAKQSDFTIAAIELPSDSVSEFGVFEVDENMRVIGFQEKPAKGAKEIPGKPGRSLASMGNYIVERRFLEEVLRQMEGGCDHPLDFGKDVVPFLIEKGIALHVYNFSDNSGLKTGSSYWRDVGKVDAYYSAHVQDIASIAPELNLYDEEWPIRTYSDNLPGAKFIGVSQGDQEGTCIASGGCIIQRCLVRNAVLSRSVRIYDGSDVRGAVLHDRVVVENNCTIHNAIVMSSFRPYEERVIPAGTKIGVNLEADRERFFVSDGGIVIVPPDAKF